MSSNVRSYARHPTSTKRTAEKMRRDGFSYREIKEKIGISKSTLSTWFSKRADLPHKSRAEQYEHLNRVRELAVLYFKKRRERKLHDIKEKVLVDISKLSPKNPEVKRAMLAMLYWAEGAKSETHWGVKFANTDPLLCRLFIYLLRSCYKIQEEKLRIQLYLHHYHAIRQSKKFWSKTLSVPTSQFLKIYLKKRSKTKRFRKNFAGICFIIYRSNDLKKELIELAYAITNKILPS